MARGPNRRLERMQADIERIAQEADVTFETAFNEFVNRMAMEVIGNTPVDTGRLRASWFLSSSMSLAAYDTPGERSTIQGIGGAGQTLSRLSVGSEQITSSGANTIYLLNGANYAIFVEANTQFVRASAARAQVIADDVVAEIRAMRGAA